MLNLKIYLYSLGCAKNQVESEMMSGILQNAGFEMTTEAENAEIIIVNTCGFLAASKQESIHAILELSAFKLTGKCRLLLAVGCMPEKYAEDMQKAMPEIDAVLGSHEYHLIAELVKKKLDLDDDLPHIPCNPYLLRSLSTPPYTAYLKIADGCDNCCAYCLIPQLRGHFYSRPMQDLLNEAQTLYHKGVKELILIAQDTTSYGIDICGKSNLPELLARIAEIGFTWIRIMYCYPNRITEELLAIMVKYDNICHYLDLPIQHSDDEILKCMNRSDTNAFLKEQFAMIRRYMPDIAIRTTVMVGFPGERVSNWHNLIDFLDEEKLSWVGVFAFSREMDTAAYCMPHQVDEKTKQRRKQITMTHIAKTTADVLQSFQGQILEILVEGFDENGVYYGRSRYQAPEVDGQVLFTSTNSLCSGEFVQVRIVGHTDYDLVGEEYELSQ